MDESLSITNDIICKYEANNLSASELNYIRETIENMNKFNQIEILKILSKYQEVTLNENNYGIHINLSDLKTEIINEIKKKQIKDSLFPIFFIIKKMHNYKKKYFFNFPKYNYCISLGYKKSDLLTNVNYFKSLYKIIFKNASEYNCDR
jgi:hypothetical protein